MVSSNLNNKYNLYSHRPLSFYTECPKSNACYTIVIETIFNSYTIEFNFCLFVCYSIAIDNPQKCFKY